MKKYELMVILKPLLPQDIRLKIENKLKKILKDNGGKIISTDVWGKKHLAYPISSHEDGYYIIYVVELEPANVAEVEAKMRMTSEYLRIMFVIKEE